MSKNLKNLFLLLTLVALCFMIKCKLDSDAKADLEENVKIEKQKSKVDSNVNVAEEIVESKEDLKKQNDEVKEEISKKEETIEDKSLAKANVAEEKKTKKTKKRVTKKKTQKPVVKAAPKIEFEELVWDFGEITEGDVVEKKFKFTNTGNARLEILSTNATCGCTRPTFPFIDINPGESNVIGVKYHSVGKDGDQNPEITVESNTNPKYTIIKLKGTVVPKKEETDIEEVDSTATKKDSSVIKN